MKPLAWLLLSVPFAYLGTCSAISASRSRAHDSIKVGDSRAVVVDAFGEPSHVEHSDKLFTRYASRPCAGCSARLWFENTLSMDTEAWSIDLDEHDRVMGKAAWHSP
jgi:hypothetical protein